MNREIVQTLDIHKNCKGLFARGDIHLEPANTLLEKFSRTWKYTPMLNNYEQKYTFLYLLLKTDGLEDFCNDPERYQKLKETLSAQSKAAITAKISLDEECFFNLLPKHQLYTWFNLRQQALENLQSSLTLPADYSILHKAHVLATNISHQPVSYNGTPGRVLYDIFGSATGRLTTKKGSVPIMTLKKEQRGKITPQNDAFVELDLNAAEIRTLIALSGREQPQEDIHEWVVENVFAGELERHKAKVELFAWLYNPSSSKNKFDKFFSREIFRDFFDPETQILTTPFGRQLPVCERKAQNYLLQSTTSDIVLQNAYKIMKMLDGKKSNIAFTLHDSVIIDMAKDDAQMIREIRHQFEETSWGPFPSTCKIGKTFGDLKALKI